MNRPGMATTQAHRTEDYDRKLIDHFLVRMVVPQIVIILLGLIESFLIWNRAPHTAHIWILGWYLIFLLITGYRLELIHRYRRKGIAHPIAYWTRRLTVAMLGSGLTWGLVWWLPGLHPSGAVIFINLLLLTGLVAGSTVTNFWIPWGSRLFALPIMVTLGLSLFSFPGDIQLIGVLMILLFWVTVDLSAQVAHKGYRDNAGLTVEAERITIQLNSKNETLAEEIERRKQAEQMIRTDQEELLLVIDSIPVFTAIVTSDLVLRRINRALGQQLGVESEGAVSIPLQSLVEPEQYATLKTRFEQTLTGQLHSFPIQLSWSADRQQRFYSAHCVPIRSLGEAMQREFILLLEDVTTLKRSELRLHHAAFHDPLTGLGNRRLLDESLLEALDRTHLGEPGILILLDLDGFKAINDREGHPVGDTVLVAAARALTHSVRKADTICRLGGDEFAIVLPSAPRETAEQIAQKIQTRIHEETTPLVQMSAPPTASIGLVALEAGDIKPEDWIAAADRGLYEAKRRGGNTRVWGHLSTP